ncbi:hypothetical protein P9314_18820 [Paenibacillus validus]|uniref:Uncharacterized protein n=1 Tax=Paenibacillus validus TaxID=44253 RepID=A0A7X2Z8Y7_9BACL|nr:MULTISPECIES: hypothetical protein [Paenibacillus]MED4602706.1 hypothetical protein [Paenibacillus validus]MED4607135.1 hypothetical protein [Paenibacillus validus]MUG70504.1 hypothetical protein [Paenibacillus validus]
MIGSIRWNFIIGAIAFIFTFMFSVGNNIWLTTLLRSVYSFAVLFILVFGCRWLLGTFAGFNQWNSNKTELGEGDSDGTKGTVFDAVTPPDQDEELHQMLKKKVDAPMPEEETFSPLNPPKLSTKFSETPEELAQAVRRMTEE